MLVETVFAWPGIGRLAYEAVFTRDHNLLIGILLISSLLVISINLVVDLLYACSIPGSRWDDRAPRFLGAVRPQQRGPRGLAVLTLIVAMALLAPTAFPDGPRDMVARPLRAALGSPAAAARHGRAGPRRCSRFFVYGARVTLLLSLVATADLGDASACHLGGVAGCYGG